MNAVPRPRGGVADVVYVLCLLEVAFLLLAGVGEVLIMGFNPAYLGLPVVKAVLLLVFATGTAGGRRWAVIGLLVLHCITVVGFTIQFWAGVLPWVDYTVNLVGLLTNLALPVGVIVACAGLLRRPRPAPTLMLPPAQDPFATVAPLATVDGAR